MECTSLDCDQSEISVQAILLANLGYRLSNGNRLPLVQAGLFAELSDPYFACDTIGMGWRQIAKDLFQRDFTLRVVESSAAINAVSSCDVYYTLDALFRMAICKTTKGCAAIRIVKFHGVSDEHEIDCSSEISITERIKASFLIDSTGTKTALAVYSGHTLSGSSYATCSEVKGTFDYHIAQLIHSRYSPETYLIDMNITP